MAADELQFEIGDRFIPVRIADEGIEWVATQITELLPDRPRLLTVSDATVSLLYENRLRDALRQAGFAAYSFVFDPGEEHKNLRTASRILDTMADQKISRSDVVIGLGGGVATDMAGFAASIYQRGIRWVAVPTSLLGMVDAAVGGKTGVDHALGKNLIGSFHQPMAVLMPLKVLKTLPQREWRSGSAEIVKMGLLRSTELWKLVASHGCDASAWKNEDLRQAVVTAVMQKQAIVSRDERESGERRLLNFGHTFGHAVETATRYSVFLHGEAVFLGMRAAVRMSAITGLMRKEAAVEIDNVLAQAVYPRADVDPDQILEALWHDKKVREGKLHWVLLESVVNPRITPEVPEEIVRDTARWLSDLMRDAEPKIESKRRVRILVLNGPNLNLLGEREPELYGDMSYDALAAGLEEFGEQEGVELLIRQSNLEGDLVGLIQQARFWADGIVINPGGYTHTSVAIRDALSGVTLPAVEVHLTDIGKREEFRRISLIAPVCRKTISGHGVDGYFQAVRELKNLIETSASQPASEPRAISSK